MTLLSSIQVEDTNKKNPFFEEMEQVAVAVEPDQIIFVMDGTIGQAAFDQAQAFKQKVNIGSVIITKLDGHSKGGGALSAVAATKSPIIFLGTGENIFGDFEEFDPQSFVSVLMGAGDPKKLMDLLRAAPAPTQPTGVGKPTGAITLRTLYDQFQMILKMGPLDKIWEALSDSPFSQLLKGSDPNAGHERIKGYITIMDSMTAEELDHPKILNAQRVNRIARGSGKTVKEVTELVTMFKKLPTKLPVPGRQGNPAQITKMIPPHLLQQMGGATGLSTLMRQMDKKGFSGK